MAFVSALSATIGVVTKLSHLNEVFQNTRWLKDKILGDDAEGSGAGGHFHYPGNAGLEVEVGDCVNGANTFATAFNGPPKVVVIRHDNTAGPAAVINVTSTGFTAVFGSSQDGHYHAIRQG